MQFNDELCNIQPRLHVNITIELTFAGINMFLARLDQSPSVARVKMSSEEGQKHIYAQEHQLYYYYNNFKGLLTFNFNFVLQKNNYT